jgi:hypothetical protein
MQFEQFPPNSRYYGVETVEVETGAGRQIVYLKRRFVPPASRFSTLQEHVVSEGERPDTLAAAYLGDPEQFWRLCDANGAMHPDELTEAPGRAVRITLPEGIPGSSDSA